eukprot:TRINITY_DN793_c0_g1_i1.p1 TRINITY_DN793_c0_g1~~TRINITY_DN793_c0_g1_i1.p1  ORF type:complete len:686 (-),score=108.11 TRINITY_DN793_c0_g1_i1:381-2438(-)
MKIPPNLAKLIATLVAALAVRVLALPGPVIIGGRAKKCDEEEEEGEMVSELSEENGFRRSIVPVTLHWRNITCTLSDKAGRLTRFLLKDVSGEAKAGRLLAIMGPSGSGKTTLLNILAGQLAASPRLKLVGQLFVNGSPYSSMTPKIAYVRQEDIFFSQLTVRETLSFAAELQLPKLSNPKRREKYVDGLLLRLGLVSCADTIVGDAKVRGISGGEKKRLSIACELIASPSVIFADEPTTGLDAFQAERVMETLRQLAQEGHTIVCSIHQPRGSIYTKFDDLVLLSQGAVVYAGPAGEEPLTYFSQCGFICQDHVNPAEFFADLISIDYSSSENELLSKNRIDYLIKEFAKRPIITSDLTLLGSGSIDENMARNNHSKTAKKKVGISSKCGWWKQFRLLLKRAWMQATRDGPTNKVRARMSIASALIFGSIFWRMGRSQTSIQDRMGLLQVAAINTAMAALTKTVNVFPKERTIVDRERTKGSYALGPYLFAKLLAEIPVGASFPLVFGLILYPMARLHPDLSRFGAFSGIVTVESFAASAMGLTVGAIAPNTEAAMALGPSLMTVFIVFGGYYVNSENTPAVFRWIPRISLIRWAFQALCINEFSGLTFDQQQSFDLQTGEQVLDRLSFGGSSVGAALAQEGRILLFWYWLTYAILKTRKPKFQPLEVPDTDYSPKITLEEIRN